jgi:hypothetical protein
LCNITDNGGDLPGFHNLPPGIRISAVRLDSQERGVAIEIERTGYRVAFDLPEAEAVDVAIAILGISIQFRDESPWWRLSCLINEDVADRRHEVSDDACISHGTRPSAGKAAREGEDRDGDEPSTGSGQ